tara:strand:- start:2078 stop:3727 length:1650 start_codon:yes stop_codon:yes gene_type:complete
MSVFLFFASILEFIGIGLLFPILEVISNKDFRSNKFFNDYLPSSIKLKTDQEILFLFLLSIVLIYIFKTIYSIILIYRQSKLIYGLNSYLSNKLYKLYLSQEYKSHLEKNSSILSKNLIIEINYFHIYINALLVILTESLLISSILLFLIWFKPISTVIIGLVFGLSAVIYFRASKFYISLWSEQRKILEEKLSITLHEGLRGIKDVKMYGVVKPFIYKFENLIFSINSALTKVNTLNSFPRYFFELFTIITLVLYILLISILDQDIKSIIPTIGIFVAATFRILPSLTKILSSFQMLKFYRPSTDIVINEFENATNNLEILNQGAKIKFNNSILIKNLFFRYGANFKPVIKNLNLEIIKGSTIGFKGASGSGKSTLIDLFVTLIKPSKGEILVDGVNIFKNINSWRNIIGYVSQFVFLSDTSISENIAFGKAKKDIDYKQLDKVIKIAQLSNFIKELPNGIETKVGENGVQLSGGQKQRIGIARALYDEPDILVFDEATSSLDISTEIEVMKAIYSLKGKKTIIIVAHRLSTLDQCDYIYKVESGELI